MSNFSWTKNFLRLDINFEDISSELNYAQSNLKGLQFYILW